MPVPLPRMCAVLAHEMRGPLGVLQGYVRLLRQRRAPDTPEAAMFEAMLEATGRLTAIAGQASSLGNWLARTNRAPMPPVDSADVSHALAERLRHSPAITLVGPTARESRLVRADPAALADAIAAVAESVRRDHEDSAVEVGELGSPTSASPWFIVRAQPTSPVQRRAGRQRPFSFDRGGAGLALITAAAVFDEHGMSLEPEESSGGLAIGFPRTDARR